jgi:hypothetical protein
MRLMTAVLIDEHVHEKVFNNRIADLLALFVIKESAFRWLWVVFSSTFTPYLFLLLSERNMA